MRAAAWPIEVADTFAAPTLAGEAASLFEAEDAVISRRAAVLTALYAAIPTVADRKTRAYLLAVKRHVHGSTEPLPIPPAHVDLDTYPAIATLIAAEARERLALAERRARFEHMYDELLREQLTALRTVTAEPRFQRALLIANATVAGAWVKVEAPRRPKRQRHLETTVFHYLMRACGRPTPNGAWAGVAPVEPVLDGCHEGAQDLVVRPVSARYEVTPSLRPFVTMLRAFARQPRYRWQAPLHLNPTVRLDPGSNSSGLRYEQDQGGIHRWVSLPSPPLITAVIGAYADGRSQPAAPLVDALVGLWPEQPSIRDALERVVTWLIDRDVLRCGLRLPSTAPDAWTALADASQHLLAPDRETWDAAITRLHDTCATLGKAFDTLTPESVADLLRAVDNEVHSLWTVAGLEGAPQPPLLHVDMRLPFEVHWSSDLIAGATQTVRALLAFHAADGGAEIFRRQTVRDVFAALEAGNGVSAPAFEVLDRLEWQVPPQPRVDQGRSGAADFHDTLEFVLGQMPPESSLGSEARDYCRGWEEFFEPIHALGTCTVPERPPKPGALPGACGALLVRFSGTPQLWIGPGRPEAALFAARFAPVIGDAPVLAALRDGLAAGMPPGLRALEVVGLDAFNPNAGLHPLHAPEVLDPHSPAGGLREVCVEADPMTQRLWLRRVGDADVQVSIYSTGAAIGYHDVCSRLLLVVGVTHGWEFLSFKMPPLRAERMRWKHLPRVVLSGRQVLSPERWTIDRQTLERLHKLGGAARYLAWRREMARVGVPALVHVRCGPDEPELLVRTDSPLAVRCLLDAYASRAPWFELSELPGDGCDWPVRDEEGRHYLAELGVSWFNPGYWSAVDPRAR